MSNAGAKTRRSFGRATGSAVLVTFLGIAVTVLRIPLSSHDESMASSALPFSFQPELYHGEGKTHHFFEGWYHKLVRTRIDCREQSITPDGDNQNLSMAVVPGVFYDSGNNVTGKNESHAFIFVTINGEKQHYYRFDLDTEFQYRRHISNGEEDKDYYVEIGNNKFSKHGMSLDLVPRRSHNHDKDANNDDANGVEDDDDASIGLKGFIEYEGISPWPIHSFWNLGAMGPVGHFLSPFLECYHDILSFDHKIKGTLAISNHDNDNEKEKKGRTTTTTPASHPHVVEEFFNSKCNDDGTYISSRGYVEKDRGQSFPSLWIWMQTNSFRKPPHDLGTSLFFSVAKVPILTTHLRKILPKSLSELEFPGFTAALWLNVVDGKDDPISNENHDIPPIDTSKIRKKLIPFATWTGAYFEDLVVEDKRVVATLNSGGIGIGFWGNHRSSSTKSATGTGDKNDDVDRPIIRAGRFLRAWIGSWFLNYDSRKLRYRLELVADRRVPHVLLYAPKKTTVIDGNKSSISTTSKMEPFVNEALNAKIHVRLFEYYRADDGKEHEQLLLDDLGEHAGLEVHQNVQYLIDNICGKAKANILMCL